MEVHQFVNSLSADDAVGPHTLEARKLFRGLGESEIFYDRADPDVAHEGKHFWEFDESAGLANGSRILLYQFSIGSKVADFLRERDEKVALYFHNITPPDFFAAYDPEHLRFLESGRRQLVRLKERVSLAIAPSSFSKADLERAGYTDVVIAPLLVDFARYDAGPDEGTVEKLRRSKEDGPDILYVSRIAPNKRHEDLIKVLHAYRSMGGKGGRLFIVGPHHHLTYAYSAALRAFSKELGLAREVNLVGRVSLPELVAYYRECDVFVSMSEHEGYGVPLLEAMYLGMPVVAYGSSAVTETVAGAGIVFPDKDLVAFATAVDKLWTDEQARKTLTEAGKRRVEEVSLERTSALLLDHLKQIA